MRLSPRNCKDTGYRSMARAYKGHFDRFPAIYRIAKQKAWFLLYSIGQSLKVIDQCPHVLVRAGTPN